MRSAETTVTLGIERFKKAFFFILSVPGQHTLIAGFRMKWFGMAINIGVRHEADLHVGATLGASSGLFANGPRWSDFHTDLSLFGFGINTEIALITGSRKKMVLQVAPVKERPPATGLEKLVEPNPPNPIVELNDDGIFRS